MLRPRLAINETSGISRIAAVMVSACLVVGWSRPAFSVEPATNSDEESHLQLAPIMLSHSVGGNIGYNYEYATDGTYKYTQQALGLGINTSVGVSSFFWQPWLAQVSSIVNANVNGADAKTNTSPHYGAVNTSLTGEAALKLVQYSRFPFSARVYKNDTRYAAFYSGSNDAQQSTGYSLSQGYTTMNRRLDAQASFSSSTGGRSYSNNVGTLDNFIFSVKMLPARYQSISLSGNTNTQNQTAQGQRIRYDEFLANHAYQPNPIFSVASLANLYNTNNRQTSGNSTSQFDSNSFQFTSFASLRPETSPLTVTSAVRFVQSDSSTNTIPTPTLKSSNFNLGANYLFSRLIRIYGSTNVNDSGGVQTVTSNASLVAAKAYGDRSTIQTDLGGFRYSGSIGGTLATTNTSTTSTVNNQTFNQSALSLGLGLSLSHALDKSSELGTGRLTKNLHQMLSMGVDSTGATTVSSLTSGGSLGWNRTEGKETTQMKLNVNDTHSLRGTQNSFQMINLQASRIESISRNESLKGNLTVQATHTQQAGESSIPNTITPSAQVIYSNQRTFRVLHLAFDSALQIADTNIAPSQPLGNRDQATRSWSNSFRYKIGRLNLSLNANISKVGKSTLSSVSFMMNRQF